MLGVISAALGQWCTSNPMLAAHNQEFSTEGSAAWIPPQNRGLNSLKAPYTNMAGIGVHMAM